MSRKRKNVLFLHLESFSQTALWQYAAELPALSSLMRRSTCFSRFYAASTSSIMSFSDLLHGDSSELDHLELYPGKRGELRGRAENLMRVLLEHGYVAHGVHYCSFQPKDTSHNFWGIWPDECGQFVWHGDRETMHRDMYDFMRGAKENRNPFALYFWNMNTHLQDTDGGRGENTAYHERFQKGFRGLDQSVGRLLDDMARLGVMEDTVIVGIGDHGDDIWRHGLYRGRSHIIDPYATLCWCPLFICAGDVGSVVTNRLTSAIDVKPTLQGLLFPGEKMAAASGPFAGIDVFKQERTEAFSQAMFALQRERTDPAASITKSYAVTNGALRVMASAPSDPDDSGGMELYLDQWDSGNTINLLRNCRMDEYGEIAFFEAPEGMGWLDDCCTATLKSEYRQLRQKLIDFIRRKEEDAMPCFTGESPWLFSESLFYRVRERNW